MCTNRRIANNPFGVIEFCVFRMWTLLKVAQPPRFHSGTLRILHGAQIGTIMDLYIFPKYLILTSIRSIVLFNGKVNKFWAKLNTQYTPCKHCQQFVLHYLSWLLPACHKFWKSEKLWTETPTCWSSYRMLPQSKNVRRQGPPEIKK